MNILDSQRLAGLLEAAGLTLAGSMASADVALLNTCSVREKAMQKVLSRLGEVRELQRETGLPRIVGLCGCVAEQEGEALFARSPVLDFVLGPGMTSHVGAAIQAVAAGERPAITGFSLDQPYEASSIKRPASAKQYVTVIHGCNQHCTFCVVPYTRGQETSRPLREVVDEVTDLARSGTREVTLLGQTINAYRCPVSGADLPDLLDAVSGVPGLWRVHFLTSHPKYLTSKMISLLAHNSRVARYLHLPVQAGSDRVLRRMNRGYTRASYLDFVSQIRAAVPEITLSSDIIVGFPGETDKDFEQTIEVVSTVEFGQLFGFLYSARPRTPASRLSERIPRTVAKERLERLFTAQAAIQLKLNRRLIGRRVEVLVDGPARRGASLWQGRGDDNRVVNFAPWEGLRAGDLANLTVTGATTYSLLGERAGAAGEGGGDAFALTDSSRGLRLET